MSVKIRLARGGAKKRPYYRIVVADIRMPRDGRYIERVGSYNPLLPRDHEDRVSLDKERIVDWLSKGAKPTDRVARFLDEAGILKREPKNNPQKAKPKKELEPKEEAVAEEAKTEVSPAAIVTVPERESKSEPVALSTEPPLSSPITLYVSEVSESEEADAVTVYVNEPPSATLVSLAERE